MNLSYALLVHSSSAIAIINVILQDVNLKKEGRCDEMFRRVKGCQLDRLEMLNNVANLVSLLAIRKIELVTLLFLPCGRLFLPFAEWVRNVCALR